MSTPKEQYDTMLDELPAEDRMRLINHVPFARVLEEFDQTAYDCGLSDFTAVCDNCGNNFCPDDYDEPAICGECKAENQDDDEDEED